MVGPMSSQPHHSAAPNSAALLCQDFCSIVSRDSADQGEPEYQAVQQDRIDKRVQVVVT
jgi:hypothetical protein